MLFWNTQTILSVPTTIKEQVMKIRLLLILTIFLFSSLMFAKKSLASVDCDSMVENCKSVNPFNEWISPIPHFAFNQGCEAAGEDCRVQQEEHEQEQPEP